jgi:hypothetical protein
MCLTSILLLLLTGEIGCKPNTNEIVQPEVEVTTFYNPKTQNKIWYIAFDSGDNLYISDTYNHVIRKVTPDGVGNIVAGTGARGLSDGPNNQAKFTLPQGLTVDKQGNLYIAQYLALRKITPDGTVSTIAGTDFEHIDFSKPDSILFVTTPAIIADKAGNLLVTDYTENSYNNRIVRVTPNSKVSVFIGQQFSYKTFPPVIQQPTGLVFDSKGNLFISDYFLGIVKVSPNGDISSFSGKVGNGHVDGPASSSTFGMISCMTIDKLDNLYLGDGRYIRKVTPDGSASTIAGSSEPTINQNGQTIYKDGPGSQAQIGIAQSMAFDSKGNLYVATGGGIRKIVLPK